MAIRAALRRPLRTLMHVDLVPYLRRRLGWQFKRNPVCRGREGEPVEIHAENGTELLRFFPARSSRSRFQTSG